ncbi:SNX8 family protein [Megaselia abdita]
MHYSFHDELSKYFFQIISRKYTTNVCRRYNDFVTLQNLLISKFPYRILPRLPPKQLMMDSLLEERRRGLQRYLQIICQHPIVGISPIIEVFLTDKSTNHQDHLQTVAAKEPDEYSTLSENAELPLEDQGRLAASREKMRILLNSVIKLTKLFDHSFVRLKNQSSDFKEMIGIVKSFEKHQETFPTETSESLVEGMNSISLSSEKSSLIQNMITEKLNLLLDVLTAHSDLCERVEGGIVSDHQKAISKMLNINKQKIKGVIRGSAAENVHALHKQEMEQTGVVGSLGRHSAFSLQCVLDETSLVDKYLQVLPSILLSFSYEQQKLTKDQSDIWGNVITKECSKFIENNN